MVEPSEEIPADIRDKAERVAGKLDDIHFNSRSASWLDDAVAIVAAALLAERNRAYEECAGRAAARQAIYEKKRAEADPLAKDEYTRWEKYDFAVEAMEYMEAAIRALLK